ncbi:hypothetical protein GYA49_02380 [Candidatus Beckwithbacteria bacterium]|nr:hypothetical protein [Candidatus Beckwithbacteria bacterium]
MAFLQFIQIPGLSGIKNSVINSSEGTYSGVDNSSPLAALIARLWLVAVILGSLAVILFLVMGAIDWISSDGDPEKIKKARNKIVDAVVGLGILVASFAIVKFLEWIFGFDILNISWPTP